MAGTSASRAPTCRRSRLPATGQETGIDLGLESFATLVRWRRASYTPAATARPSGALKTAQRRVSRRKKGSNRRRKAVQAARQGASEGEAPARRLPPQDGARTGAAVRHDLSRRLADGQHGQESPPRQEHQRRGLVPVPDHPQRQGSMRRALESSPCLLPTPARPVLAAASSSRRACPSAGMPARTAARACIGTTTPRRT